MAMLSNQRVIFIPDWLRSGFPFHNSMMIPNFLGSDSITPKLIINQQGLKNHRLVGSKRFQTWPSPKSISSNGPVVPIGQAYSFPLGGVNHFKPPTSYRFSVTCQKIEKKLTTSLLYPLVI